MAAQATARKVYSQRTYLAESLDPIHIGTGEFQLGRVDNTIIREPGTDLPKIPGSSIAGVCRAYAAMAKEKYRRGDGQTCAGKGGDEGKAHCGQPDCPICTVFGFSKKNKSFQGLAQFSDARIVFFPVYSAIGPVWVTCPEALESAGITNAEQTSWPQIFSGLGDNVAFLGTTLPDSINPGSINLGWLYFPKQVMSPPAVTSWQVGSNGLQRALTEVSYLTPVIERLTVVSDARFSTIVNDQLEIRTSVSISPESGAAEEGALFTAEAIPRACFFSFTVTHLDPENFRVPNGSGGGLPIVLNGKPADIDGIAAVVRAGLELIEFLGIGGVNTRGMGRLRVILEQENASGI